MWWTVPSFFDLPFWAMKPTENVLFVVMMFVLFFCFGDLI